MRRPTRRARGRIIRPPRLFAVYGWRYEDKHTRDGLRRNLAWVDELVEVDDRGRTGQLWVHEGQYRQMQRQALMDAGIRPWDWVLVTSPDERWDDTARQLMPPLIRHRRRVAWHFPLREMWRPTAYRVDGLWGRKMRPRLYPFLPDQRFTRQHIQTAPTPVDGLRHLTNRSINIYHLESIEPASRVERAIVYKALDMDMRMQNPAARHWRKLDPGNRYFRRYGYAYLADPRGMVLQQLSILQRFTPAYDPRKPFIFRVPDHLLKARSGKTRAQLLQWLEATLETDLRTILNAR